MQLGQSAEFHRWACRPARLAAAAAGEMATVGARAFSYHCRFFFHTEVDRFFFRHEGEGRILVHFVGKLLHGAILQIGGNRWANKTAATRLRGLERSI